MQTDNCGPGLSLRNRLGERRSRDTKIASRWDTIQTVYSKMGSGDRGCINHVIVDVDNRPSHRRTPDAREGYVKEKSVARGETAKTENLFMRNTQTIQPGDTSCPGTVDAVNIFTRVRENNVGCRNTRDGEYASIHLYQYVEAVERHHIGDVNPEIDRHRGPSNQRTRGRGDKDRGSPGRVCSWGTHC